MRLSAFISALVSVLALAGCSQERVRAAYHPTVEFSFEVSRAGEFVRRLEARDEVVAVRPIFSVIDERITRFSGTVRFTGATLGIYPGPEDGLDLVAVPVRTPREDEPSPAAIDAALDIFAATVLEMPGGEVRRNPHSGTE